MVPACLLRRNQKERATLIHVPDLSFQKVEGMHYTDSPQTKLFYSMSDSFTKKSVAAPQTLVKIVSNKKVRVVNEGAFN